MSDYKYVTATDMAQCKFNVNSNDFNLIKIHLSSGECVGTISAVDGKIHFGGDLDASAKTFFESFASLYSSEYSDRVNEIATLRAALREYGECKPDCDRMCCDDRPCNCGYIKLLEGK